MTQSRNTDSDLRKKLRLLDGSLIPKDATIIPDEEGKGYHCHLIDGSIVRLVHRNTRNSSRLKYENGTHVSDEHLIVEIEGQQYAVDEMGIALPVYKAFHVARRIKKAKTVNSVAAADDNESLPESFDPFMLPPPPLAEPLEYSYLDPHSDLQLDPQDPLLSLGGDSAEMDLSSSDQALSLRDEVESIVTVTPEVFKFRNGDVVPENAVLTKEGNKTFVVTDQGRARVFPAARFYLYKLKFANGEWVEKDAEVIQEGNKFFITSANENIPVFESQKLKWINFHSPDGAVIPKDTIIEREGSKYFITTDQGTMEVFPTEGKRVSKQNKSKYKYAGGKSVSINNFVVEVEGKSFTIDEDIVQVFKSNEMYPGKLFFSDGSPISDADHQSVTRGRNRGYYLFHNGKHERVFTSDALRMKRCRGKRAATIPEEIPMTADVVVLPTAPVSVLGFSLFSQPLGKEEMQNLITKFYNFMPR